MYNYHYLKNTNNFQLIELPFDFNFTYKNLYYNIDDSQLIKYTIYNYNIDCAFYVTTSDIFFNITFNNHNNNESLIIGNFMIENNPLPSFFININNKNYKHFNKNFKLFNIDENTKKNNILLNIQYYTNNYTNKKLLKIITNKYVIIIKSGQQNNTFYASIHSKNKILFKYLPKNIGLFGNKNTNTMSIHEKYYDTINKKFYYHPDFILSEFCNEIII